MSLSVRKLFIDSRFAVSGDSSSFQYELPEVVELPHDTVAFVTEFISVASWDTVNANNNQIYLLSKTRLLSTRPVSLPLPREPMTARPCEWRWKLPSTALLRRWLVPIRWLALPRRVQ